MVVNVKQSKDQMTEEYLVFGSRVIHHIFTGLNVI